MDLARSDAAEREISGELAAEVGSQQAVACVFVARHGAGGEEVREAVVRGGGAAGEGDRGGGAGGH